MVILPGKQIWISVRTENAIKAMEADRAIIESKKGCSYVIKSDIDGDVSYLELIKEPIMDTEGTGQGISEKSMASLFDPFVRLNEKKNANIQGTGLGLSVVKKIIDNMNGDIFVESEVGCGSTFTVRIPADIADNNMDITVTDEQKKPKVEIDYSKLRVLCVYDSSVNAIVMASLLKKIGMSADVAYSAQEGIEKADILMASLFCAE